MDQVKEGDLIMRGPAPFIHPNGQQVYEILYNRKFAASIYKSMDGSMKIRVHIVLTSDDFVAFWIALGKLAASLDDSGGKSA